MPMPLNTRGDLARFCQRHDALIGKLMDAMTEANIHPLDGQQLLAFLIGTSAGLTDGSVLAPHITQTMAQAFQVAQAEGGSDFR